MRYSKGSAFLGSRIYNGEKFFPDYTISIDEVKVNGEVRELSGKEYTCSDDDNCTRVNLYNQWVTSIPDDCRCAEWRQFRSVSRLFFPSKTMRYFRRWK
ncbi:MAG: hypothetical protein ACLTZI_15930 [[Eubacterium] siraeum]